MKAVRCGVVALVAVVSVGAKLATEKQALVIGAMEKLKYEFVPNKDGVVGGPADFKVTRETVEYLEKLHKNGDTITVNSEGEINVDDDGTGGAEISEDQALVDAALKVLKLEQVKGSKVGGPSKFKVSRETMEQNRKWHRQGTILVVDNNGKVKPK